MDSNDKIDRDKVQALVDTFLDIIEGTINTVDHIAEVNTVTYDGNKMIKAANFRMNLRNLKVRLLEDLANQMQPESLPSQDDNLPEPPKAS